MIQRQHPSGAVDIFLGGFEIDSSDSTKFVGIVQSLALTHARLEISRGQNFSLEVWGLSDCIGDAERNNRLRLARAFAVASALRGASKSLPLVITRHVVTDFAASNLTRAGRRQNRGVLIRLVPQVTPERFGTPTMKSRKWGVTFSAVTPQAELRRALSEDEILSVALTIFAAQSTAFEHLRGWRDVIPFAPPSSRFAEEDLPFNLIGFYRAARGFGIEEVRSYCGAWDEQRSIDKLRSYEFAPNPTFQPQRLPRGGAWPAEFQTIEAAPFTSEAFKIVQLRLEVPLVGLELNCSIDAETNSIKFP